jgi:hypothetical protein
MQNQNRKYISIYFSDAVSFDRKKGYITVAFDVKSALYKKIKKIRTPELKKILGIVSYSELISRAADEDRKIGSYIKHSLKKILKVPNE